MLCTQLVRVARQAKTIRRMGVQRVHEAVGIAAYAYGGIEGVSLQDLQVATTALVGEFPEGLLDDESAG